jgi:hypothetical protein
MDYDEALGIFYATRPVIAAATEHLRAAGLKRAAG